MADNNLFAQTMGRRGYEIRQFLTKQLPVQIGNMAVTHFTQNFRREGFYNETGAFEKWPARKRADKGPRRGLLVKKGKLRNSIRVISRSPERIVIGSGLPYAKIHNEGGNIPKPARQAIVRLRTDGKGSFLRQEGNSNLARFAKRGHKRVTEAKVNIAAHSIAMPQRQFIGESKRLNGEIKGQIAKGIRMILTQ